MTKRIIVAALLTLLSGCGAGGGGGDRGDTNITCINNQPLQVTLPPGSIPTIAGDGTVIGDVSNPDGTHTFTISGCNFDITGDTNIHDSGNSADSHNS